MRSMNEMSAVDVVFRMGMVCRWRRFIIVFVSLCCMGGDVCHLFLALFRVFILPRITSTEATVSSTMEVMIHISVMEPISSVGSATANSSPRVYRVMERVGTPFSTLGRLFTRRECTSERTVMVAVANSVSNATAIIMLAMMLSICFYGLVVWRFSGFAVLLYGGFVVLVERNVWLW